MKKTIILFSVLILCIILLFQVGKFTYFKGEINKESMIAITAIVFFFIGVHINKKSFGTNYIPDESTIDHDKIKELRISNREYDVLTAMSEDLTNKQIADKLYISESTAKKHISRIFSKLGVSRRVEALKKAKKLNII